MKQRITPLQFNQNPEHNPLGITKERGLFIGLMVGAENGLYVNTLKTGVSEETLQAILAKHPQIKTEASIIEMLDFLENEGDRTAYSILLPYLLSASNEKDLELTINSQFFGIKRFVQHSNHLYRFLELTKENDDIIIDKEDLRRGILAWDMARLVTLSRIAYEKDYITEKKAWENIEFAEQQCVNIFKNWEEVGKSFIIGQAMELEKEDDLELIINHFLSATQSNESPWKNSFIE